MSEPENQELDQKLAKLEEEVKRLRVKALEDEVNNLNAPLTSPAPYQGRRPRAIRTRP